METNETDIAGLYLRLRGKMLRLASLLLRDEDAAQDAVSEVFLKVLSSNPDNRNMEGLLLTAVRNRCISIIRSKQRAGMTRLDESMPIAGETHDEEERLQRIERYINERLTEQTRRVITLRFREKRKYAEIAAELHISEAAVYKHLAQGLEKLRKEFNQ